MAHIEIVENETGDIVERFDLTAYDDAVMRGLLQQMNTDDYTAELIEDEYFPVSDEDAGIK